MVLLGARWARPHHRHSREEQALGRPGVNVKTPTCCVYLKKIPFFPSTRSLIDSSEQVCFPLKLLKRFCFRQKSSNYD